jgi:hypothetical protein
MSIQLKKNILSIIIFILLIPTFNFAQENFELFPSDLLIQPFTANTLKPKFGFEFKTTVNELKLNVGNSMDIIHYKLDQNSKLSFGADMFTYTLLRSQTNFHFPVDAVDYLFGFNFGYKTTVCNDDVGARLRISHISAHSVDGHFDKKLNEWRDGRVPQVYSREFFELLPFIKINDLRLYGGMTYIFHIDPSNIGKDQYQIGFDYFAANLISKNLTPYIAYDFKLVNIYGYTGNNSFEAGLKLGKTNEKGISFFLQYFSGYNIHGEYFDVWEHFGAFGFNLDL